MKAAICLAWFLLISVDASLVRFGKPHRNPNIGIQTCPSEHINKEFWRRARALVILSDKSHHIATPQDALRNGQFFTIQGEEELLYEDVVAPKLFSSTDKQHHLPEPVIRFLNGNAVFARTIPFVIASSTLFPGEIYVAFRGSTTAADWKDDFDLQLKKERMDDDDLSLKAEKFPDGFDVHAGFYLCYKAVKDLLFNSLTNVLEHAQKPVNAIYFTGHSLGAAVAQLAALDVAKNFRKGEEPKEELKVFAYTFGSPKVGGKEYSRAIEASGVQHIRIVNHNDLVPKVPRPNAGRKQNPEREAQGPAYVHAAQVAVTFNGCFDRKQEGRTPGFGFVCSKDPTEPPWNGIGDILEHDLTNLYVPKASIMGERAAASEDTDATLPFEKFSSRCPKRSRF